MRQMALQGALPRYNELNTSESLFGGSAPYLVGSAFLEWLVEKEGEKSLVDVWSRMTARTSRGFAASFAGVYGASPAELYGRFAAELTARAFEFEKIVGNAGREEGALFQRFVWSVGSPALSPSGRELALAVGSRWAPTRIVVLLTADDTTTDAMRRAAERAAQLDPEDVPAVLRNPRPHRELASLESPPGRPYANPRFMRDGSLLVTRVEGLGNNTERSDLFHWNWRENTLRRITRRAGVRHPDPAPSGTWAAATQCEYGKCSVVRVALADGSITVLAHGSLLRTFHKPRVSPDGGSVLASLHERGRWSLVRIDVSSGALTPVQLGDDVSRFDAEFVPDGSGFVTVSAAGGVHNLEFIDPSSGTARRITNVVGAALAPTITPRGDSVYFLSLRGDGYEIRRIALATTAAIPILTDAQLFLATAQPTVPADTLAETQLQAGKSYGLGPQRAFWVPHAGADATGVYGAAVFSLSDPVVRLPRVVEQTGGGASCGVGGTLRKPWPAGPTIVGIQFQQRAKKLPQRATGRPERGD
jgi:Tol biopolymer transport system component